MTRTHRISLAVRLFLMTTIIASCIWITRDASAVLRKLVFRDHFEKLDLNAWQLPWAEDWEILGNPQQRYLHMKRKREPGVPRRPLQFALLKTPAVGSFEFQTRLRREGKSMIVVFNYVDTLHYYYAHLSGDRGREQPVHNGVFIVNGEPRQRIAGEEALPALPDMDWHQVRVARQARSGSINIFMDGSPQPLFSLIDHTFTCGRIGIGSFDETGDFADVELSAQDAGCKPGAVIRPAAGKVKSLRQQ